MGRSHIELGAAAGEMPCHANSDHDPVRRFFAVLPRPLRFLGVGGLGLITDLAVFTLIIAQAPPTRCWRGSPRSLSRPSSPGGSTAR